MIKIQNEHFCLGISPIGAELDYLHVHDVNILWQKSALWFCQSPILFPIIGSLKDGYYLYQGEKYQLPVHGFVKDKPFRVEQSSLNEIKLVTTYNEETLKMYPFKYELSITYTLVASTIKVLLEVQNLDDKPMYFSIGLHPGFSYRGLKEALGGKNELHFYPEILQAVDFNPTFVQGQHQERISFENLTQMSRKLAETRTLCYQGLKKIELKCDRKTLLIQNEMSHMAFWQKNPENPDFICMEPWHGLPDQEDTDHDLEHKAHLTKLDAKHSFQTGFEISIL